MSLIIICSGLDKAISFAGEPLGVVASFFM